MSQGVSALSDVSRSPTFRTHRGFISKSCMRIVCAVVLAACGTNTPGAMDGIEVPPGSVAGSEGSAVTNSEGLEFTLLTSECVSSATLEAARPDTIWVGFEITVRNTTPEAFNFRVDGAPFAAYADGEWEGREARDVNEDASYPDEWRMTLETNFLPAGATATGWLVYAVPRPRVGLDLYYRGRTGMARSKVRWQVSCV